jgi:hypothetical protein
MTAISITAANVLKGTGAITQNVVWGGTVTAGMAVYEMSDGRFAAGDSDTSSTTATVAGVALTGGGAGQPGVIQTGGRITIGGTVTVGESYYLGDANGSIIPYGDRASSDYVSLVGIGVTTAIIDLRILNSGVVVPA